MREFFKSELETLKAKTGLLQYEKISTDPDAANQVTVMLDSIVYICNEFPFIPDEDKKRIVQEMMIKDPEFQGFNSRVVWRWFNARKDFYFKEIAHQEKELTPEEIEKNKPVTGEAKERYIKEFLEKIHSAPMLQPVKTDIYKEVKESWKPKGDKYNPLPDHEAQAKIIHLEYIKANYHPKTQRPLPGWLPEDQWTKEYLK